MPSNQDSGKQRSKPVRRRIATSLLVSVSGIFLLYLTGNAPLFVVVSNTQVHSLIGALAGLTVHSSASPRSG